MRMHESVVRELLDTQRQATMDRITALTLEFEGIVAAAGSNVDDEHDPEGSTVAFERAQVAARRDEARAQLDDLEQAVARLDAGTYSVCERCNAVIAAERLVARPGARTCVRCAASSSSRLRTAQDRPRESGDG